MFCDLQKNYIIKIIFILALFLSVGNNDSYYQISKRSTINI